MTKTSTTLVKCRALLGCFSNPAKYENNISSGLYVTKPSATRIADFALSQLNSAKDRDEAQHAANLPIIAENQAARDKIRAAAIEAGIPDSYMSPDKNSRALRPKLIKYDAGYISDFRKFLPIDDGYNEAMATYARLKVVYEAYKETSIAEAEAYQKARLRDDENIKRQRRANIKLAQIVIRYGLPEDAGWEEVLEELRKRDQRLDLAIAMQDTRGDWSNGYWRVEDALSRFKPVTDEDKEIVADINSCFTDHTDGRVFRDTTWSYSRLFSSAADQQLVSDIQEACLHAGQH